MMPEQQQRILGYFIEEAKDHLNTIEQGLLDLQATIEDPETVNEVFRAAHSVKGGAAMLGINSIQRTSHRLEDYFKILKESPAKVDRTLESMFLQVFDGLQSLLEELQGPFGLTEDKAQEVMTSLEPVFEQLEGHLNVLVANSPVTVATPSKAAPITAPQSEKVAASTSEMSALNLVFKSDVPSHLREMLSLFKQVDTDTSRDALQACCDSLERIGEQFELNRWCELTSATRQVVGNRDQTYRSLAPVVIKELKQAQEQILAGQAEGISISEDLQILIPPVPESATVADDMDALFTDALPVSQEAAESPFNLFEEEQPGAADADLDWLDLPSSSDANAEEVGTANTVDDLMTSLESLDDTDSGAFASTKNQEPSVGASELNSLADLFEGEISSLDSPWEEVSEIGETATEQQGPDISIPDDFSDLLENTLEDEAADDSQTELADLFGSAEVEGDTPSSLELEVTEVSSEPLAMGDDFADLFDLTANDDNEASPIPISEVTSNESADLDTLLDRVATDGNDVGSQELDLTTDTHEALELDTAFDDLGELFAEGGSADFAEDLGEGSLSDAAVLTPEATEFEVLETPDLTNSEELLSDLSGNEVDDSPEVDAAIAPSTEFDEINDPWATETAEEEISDDSALDALDELWSESHDAAEAAIPTPEILETGSDENAIEDQFSDFEALDVSLVNMTEVAGDLDDRLMSETEGSGDLAELLGDNLDALPTEANNLEILVAEEAAEEAGDFSGLFEESANLSASDSLADSEGDDALDFDALMANSPDVSESSTESGDANFDALLGENLDMEVSPEAADPFTSDGLGDFLDPPEDETATRSTTDLDDLLDNESVEVLDSGLPFEEVVASDVITDSSSETLSFEDIPDFETPSGESDSLFSNGLEELDIPGDAASESDLLFNDLTTEPLSDSDPTTDLIEATSLTDFEDVFVDAPRENELNLDGDDINPTTSDIDDLFGDPASAALELDATTNQLPDNNDLGDLFSSTEASDEAIAIAEDADTNTDIFDLESNLESDQLDLTFSGLEDESETVSANNNNKFDDFLGDDFSTEAIDENKTNLVEAVTEDFFAETLDTSTDTTAATLSHLDFELGEMVEGSSENILEEGSLDNLLEMSVDEVDGTSTLTPPTDEAISDFFEASSPLADAPISSSGDPLATDELFEAAEDALSLEMSPNDNQALDELELETLGDNDIEAPLEATGLDTEMAELFETTPPATDTGLDEAFNDLGLETIDNSGITADLFEATPPTTETGLDEAFNDLGLETPESLELDTNSLWSDSDLEGEATDLFESSDPETETPFESQAIDIDLPSDSSDTLDFNTDVLDASVLFEDSNPEGETEDLFSDTEQLESDTAFDIATPDVDLSLDIAESSEPDVNDLFEESSLDIATPDVDLSLDIAESSEPDVNDLFEESSLDIATPDVDLSLDIAESSEPDVNDLFEESSLDIATPDVDLSLDIAESSEFAGSDVSQEALEIDMNALLGDDLLGSEMNDLFSDTSDEPAIDTTLDISPEANHLGANGSDAVSLETNDVLGDINLEESTSTSLEEDIPEIDTFETSIVTDASSDDFTDLETLLGDEVDQPTTETFDDLDALLSDEPAEPNSLANFDELDALLQDDPVAAPTQPVESDAADFSELDALLDEEETESSTDAPPDTDSEDEFSDLEKLLEEADQTLGGSSPTMRAKTSSRASRRVGAMVDQTMRVSVKHLDILNNLVGELVVNRNSLEQDQERLRQFLDNLLFQVQQLNDVGQRMRDLYERSLLESSLMSSRQSLQGTGITRSSDSRTGDNGGTTGHATGATFDALEMDRFTGFHTLSQEMIELIVRVRESASDIGYTVESSDQITRQFRQVTTQLQEGLNKARMVPFAQTADRLPRAVRDISLKCGKEARLVVEGRDTLIDKMILERLYDPMTHLVNNAITHGIETPEERLALGKSREGIITVRAFYQGNQTVIYIADDGGGIDPDLVKRKAVKKGILTPADANEMGVLETYELLFRPGFSTRDQADAFAGRGVGMDVVRTALSEIRGSITIDSELGKGTSFTIRLPLTLSISKALSCLNNQARIAFPMDGVEDMFDVPKDRIQINDKEQKSIQWRDTRLTFQPLSELLQFNRSLGRGRVYGGNQDEDAVSIVVLRSANTFIGLQVDRVLGEQEIVIKQLEGPVPKPIGIAGATVLGDGRVMPIADVLELIDIAQGRIRREAGSSLWTQADEPPLEELVETKAEPTVLIVDDSITVRELLSMSFNKVGYRVEQARDGQEAWEKLRSGLPCDLVFCDIEMPRMDGLELLSRLQKDTALKRIPIAMLTSRGADRHRQMAIDLGANGYFTKPYLEEALLDAAQRMLNGEVLLKPAE